MRILVVEDEKILCDTIAKGLHMDMRWMSALMEMMHGT